MDFHFSYHLFIVCCYDYYTKRTEENRKEWRIILGTYAVLADVFFDIRLGPISIFPYQSFRTRNPSRVEAGLRDGRLDTSTLWGGGGGADWAKYKTFVEGNNFAG